jgi:hypothetical protein
VSYLILKPGNMGPTLDAIDRLIAEVQVSPRLPLEKYGRDATTAMKDQHERDAHQIQRYVNRTYYLTTSIGYEVQRIAQDTWRLRMFAPPYYAEAVEYGTAKSAAYPFFWVAVYGFEMAAVTDITRAYLGCLSRHEATIRGLK